MEVWVLEVYGVVYILQELFIVKFDDMQGCNEVFNVIVKGKSIFWFGILEFFKVLMWEL